jgi:FdhD protein
MTHILMVSSYPLFSQGIESLLCREVGLEIVGRETDFDRAIERINELQPDVVILDSADPAWQAASAVMRILKERLGIKVIGLNLQDNTICVYREERRMAKGVKDLVEAIKENPGKSAIIESESGDLLLDEGIVKRQRNVPTEVYSPGFFRWQGMRWGAQEPEEELVPVEAPLEIRVDGQVVALPMRTPGSDEELAVGYCLGEGILPSVEVMESVAAEGDGEAPSRVVIHLRSSATLELERLSQPHFFRSGGAANAPGSWGCDVPALGAGIQLSAHVLQGAVEVLASAQHAYKTAGGMHAVGIFSADGALVVVREDIGRHNALDKALGYCALHGITLTDKFALTTGRVNHEVVTKSARLGLCIMASRSSAFSLAVQLADGLNQTLVGYLRPDRFIAYTHPWRLSE